MKIKKKALSLLLFSTSYVATATLLPDDAIDTVGNDSMNGFNEDLKTDNNYRYSYYSSDNDENEEVISEVSWKRKEEEDVNLDILNFLFMKKMRKKVIALTTAWT